MRICINQLLYTPKHTARLLQVLKKQFPTCQITVTTEVYNGVWDAIINNQANIAIGAPDTLLDGGGDDAGWTGSKGDDVEMRIDSDRRRRLTLAPVSSSVVEALIGDFGGQSPSLISLLFKFPKCIQPLCTRWHLIIRESDTN